jgi:hypothetical protein
MFLADIVVAGFMLIMALVGLVALPCFLFSMFGLFESFQLGSSGSRFLACMFFIASGFALAFSGYFLVPSLQLSREMWIGLSLVIAFPILFIIVSVLHVRRRIRRNE